MPHLHPKYKQYFVDRPAELALTYQWTSTFRELRAFLNQDNIRRHNRVALDPNPGLWARLALMSFAWVWCPVRPLLPEDIDARTIFIDIMANDQNSPDIATELAKAEREYQGAPYHIIVATAGVLRRAWCLFEVAVRRGAGGRSQVLAAGGEERARIGQEEMAAVRPVGMVGIIFMRAWTVFLGSVQVGGALLRLVCGIDVRKNARLGAMSQYASVDAAGKQSDMFRNMQATVEGDKAAIRGRALQVFGSADAFDATVAAATLRFGGSRVELALLLWLEAGLFLAGLPAHAAAAAASLAAAAAWLLCHLCLRLAGRRLYAVGEGHELVTRSGMSRLGASVFLVWSVADGCLKLPLLAAVGAAVAPIWAAAAALVAGAAACGGCARRVWVGRAASGGEEVRGAAGGEMALVVAAALVYPIVAPLAVLGVLLFVVFGFFVGFLWQESTISGLAAAAASRAAVRVDAEAPPAAAGAAGQSR